MKIAIASGKGGTGKTTVAVNLANVMEGPVLLLDCDVEEPNAHLFLPTSPGEEITVTVPRPQIDETLCTGCGACSDFCAYSAIAMIGTMALVFPEMCHGCGGCMRICPTHAISETERRLGVIEISRSTQITLITGRLDIGSPQATPLIRSVKRYATDDVPVLIDAPPGTSCPVIAAIQDTDLAILVTEPTPFGLSDLEMALATTRMVGIPAAVIVNRADQGNRLIHEYCKRENIPVIGEIPHDRRIAEAYSRGDMIGEELPEYRTFFEKLAQIIKSILSAR